MESEGSMSMRAAGCGVGVVWRRFRGRQSRCFPCGWGPRGANTVQLLVFSFIVFVVFVVAFSPFQLSPSRM